MIVFDASMIPIENFRQNDDVQLVALAGKAT